MPNTSSPTFPAAAVLDLKGRSAVLPFQRQMGWGKGVEVLLWIKLPWSLYRALLAVLTV